MRCPIAAYVTIFVMISIVAIGAEQNTVGGVIEERWQFCVIADGNYPNRRKENDYG